MRIRIWDRILAAISGLMLIGVGLFSIIRRDAGEVLFVTDSLEKQGIIATAFFYGGILAVVLGLYLLGYLFRGLKKKNSLVIQKTDYGELTIAVKAIEGMVLKCVREYHEVDLLQTKIDNTREGIVVKLKVNLVQDISIPLTVNTLQKQIKQYVTASAGIDVLKVQVEVVSTDKKGAKGNFAIKQEAPAPLVKKGEEQKPFHQSLFEKEEEPYNQTAVEPKEEQGADILEEHKDKEQEAQRPNENDTGQGELEPINDEPEEEQ